MTAIRAAVCHNRQSVVVSQVAPSGATMRLFAGMTREQNRLAFGGCSRCC
jgi:hypothetical protein